jgi:hypothetical protein
MKVGSRAIVGFTLAIALVAYSSRAVAQTTMHSFEAGIGAWTIGTGALASHTTGATDGTKSLQATHLGGFVYLSDGFGYHNDWVASLPAGESISFDITLDENSNPLGATFLDTRIAFNDASGYQESNSTQPDVSIPLVPGTYTATFDLGFWNQPAPWEWNSFDIALNSDLAKPLLVYIDNVRVNPPAVPEPSTLVGFGLGLVGVSAVGLRRKK